MTRMVRRTAPRLFLGALVTVILLLPTVEALAHGDIQRRLPSEGATRKRPPGHVLIEFTEAPTEDSVIRVMDGCGRDVVSEQYVEGRTKHVFLRRGRAQPGEWEVSYRVISAEDGHLTRGSYNFTVRGDTDCTEPEPEPEPAEDPNEDGNGGPDAASGERPGPDEGDGFPVVPVTLGAVGIVGLAALARILSARGGA